MHDPKTTLCIICWSVIAAGACGCSSPQQDGNSPAQNKRGVFQELSHDFGLVKPNDIKTVSLEIVNNTDAPLTLQDISSGCSCTIASVDHSRLGIGESGIVKLNYHAPKNNSDAEKTVLVQYVDARGEARVCNISIRAMVRIPLTVTPNKLVFKADNSCAFTVTNYSDVLWEGLVVDGDGVDVQVHQIADAVDTSDLPQKWRIVAVKKESANDRVAQALKISGMTGNDATPGDTFSEVVEIFPAPKRPDLEAYPDRLFFGVIPDNTAVKKRAIIMCSDDLFDVENPPNVAYSGNDNVEFSLKPDASQGAWILDVSVQPVGNRKRVSGELTISIHGEDQQSRSLTLPLSGIVKLASIDKEHISEPAAHTD